MRRAIDLADVDTVKERDFSLKYLRADISKSATKVLIVLLNKF